ncbi:unnamed protein product [Closterium sp. NIES-54]
MYALSISAEGDYYLCVPPDPGIEAAALGASDSALPGTAPAEALHTFTLDLGASHCFFRNSTTLTPLFALVLVRMADPSEGPALARSSTILPCLAVPSGSLSGLHLPSFSTNLVSTAALQDAMVTTTTPGGQCVSICTCTRTGHHLATFTHRRGSSLYRLATLPPHVAASAQVSASGQVAPPCSCRLLSHQTLLWLHHLGHPSLPGLRGMHSRLLVYGCLVHPGLPQGQVAWKQNEELLVVTLAPPSLRGALLPPSCPLLPLLLLPTCLVLSRSARRLPLVGDIALAGARGARARVELEGAVAVAAEAAEGVGVAAGVVVGVVVVVAAAAEAAVGVAAVVVVAAAEVEAAEEAAEEAVVVEGVELVRVVLSSGAAVVVASASSSSSSSVRGTSLRLSSFVSGTLSVRGCGGAHPTQRCFGRLTDAWRQQFPGASEIPRWDELLRAGVAIFDLDFDAILAAMYAVTYSEENEGYRCFQPDPGIGTAALGACEAAALGASASALSGTGETALSGTASPSSSLTFTLDSGASRSFFRDRTTLTLLGRPVAVSLADPSGGPVLSHFSTVLLCPAAPSGTLSGLYLPSFSTNLVSGADLQDAGVHQFTPASQRVTHCTDARIGRHLATFSRRPGSSLYTLTTAPPPVPASGQVAASGQMLAAASRSGPESAPCSCRLLSHETLLWHHRLGHPSLPRLRSMASRVLVSGLPRSLPPLPSGPGPSCGPCVEGRLRATPHSSQFTPTEAPLQTLHMDVWGPAPVRGQGHERYFLLVVDDYSRYTTVLPLRSKGAVTEVLIDWIREARLQLRKSFGSDFPVLRLHSDRGGEFSSRLLRDYCRARGIRQTFTLPDSPQQNGIAERRIGMVMDVARTSMMHAAAPHFLWPFAVRYAAHQLNLHPRVSRPAMSPVLLWTGKVGDASAFRVWGSRAFVRDLSADKLSPRAAPCVFLGFPDGGTSQSPLRFLLCPSSCSPVKQASVQRLFAGSRGLTTLAALGFAPSTADPSLFLRTDTSLPPFYILVYVDDLVFATADTAGLAYVKSELLKRHTCTDLGELRSYLGLQITRDRARRTITLTQSHMVQQVLQRFGFTYSSPQATPLSTGHSLSALPSDESVESSGPYPELVGCLMYLMTCTRPDLAYSLSILARYVAPGRHRPEHMAAAKRVLRYLCSTSGMGLVLGGRSPVVLTGHADASWADDQATQRSSQGYTFSLGSGSVSWRSTRSSSVLGSSCEAEIYAGAMAAQELRWLTYLLTDLGEPPRSPPVLYVDNKAMLALCREQRLEHRTKHIALRYFLARELQQRGQLRLAYVASEANTADVFTKALAPCDHQRFCTQLGLVPVLPHLLSS